MGTNLTARCSLLLILFLASVCAGFAQASSGFSKVDSLEHVLSKLSAHDTSRISVMKNLSKLLLLKDARKSAAYAVEAADLSTRLQVRVDPMLYIYAARGFARIPDIEQALSTYKLALASASDQQDTAMMARVHNATGFHYYNLRNIPAALLEFNKAIDYATIAREKALLAEAWYGKVLTYNIFEEYNGMYNAIRQYLVYADSTREQRRLSDIYRLMGTYFREISEFQDAIDANRKSFEIAAAISDSLLMGAALNHMAWYYYEMGQLDKSLELYHQNIGFYKPGGTNELANVYGNIGNIYRDWERYPEAIDNYNKSIELSRKSHDIYNLSWLYEDISKLYERTGDYRQAYENQVLASLYGDSLNSMTYQQSLATARAQYEADKTARELELLSMRLQRNKLLFWVLIGGFALIASVAALLITRYRLRSRQRIAEMNHTISELNQTNLRQQMNPHFIFNTLNSIQYYVFQNDKIASNNYMTKFASLIRKTLENSRHTVVSISEELDALKLYLELEALRFKEKFVWSIQVDEEIDTLSYKIPTMLIQPYVENAITHGLMNKENGKGNLLVQLKLLNDQILCTVEDNGIGREKAMEIRLEKNTNHRSMGTNITESRLRLVNEIYGKSMKVVFTDLMDGSGQPAGTRVEINIPIIT